MDDDKVAVIHLLTDAKTSRINYSADSTAEDLCIEVCKKIGIGPVARHLFALRDRSTRLWLSPSYKLGPSDNSKFEFRLRFKPSTLERLQHLDLAAHNYYFHQVRSDVIDNKVPEIIYEKHKSMLIGLGVSDMYRVMLETGVSRETVESDYKKYIPKECIKTHRFFIKKPIHNSLISLNGHNPQYVKQQYLTQFANMAPKYPYEEYKPLVLQGISKPPTRVLLRVNATDVQCCEVDNVWTCLCAIEDLCYINIWHDGSVEISRKSGIPLTLKFTTNDQLMSFVSALTGYYRLTLRWTFNLCQDFVTPSLEKLYRQKCHGPVGGVFSYAKLREKRSNEPGTFILRESESDYDAYYVDVCGKDYKPRTYKIEQQGPKQFVLPDSTEVYTSLRHLIASHQDEKGAIYLSECLPPSEYDVSPLLLCASENITSDVAADEMIVAARLDSGPTCIPAEDLQVYKARPFPKSDDGEQPRHSPTILYRAMWKIPESKKLQAVIKVLKAEECKYTPDIIDLAIKWGKLRSGAIVRLYGITKASTVGMLLEFVNHGPLDAYLRENGQSVQTADMVEASTCLATALWHLEEKGIIHGNIRCRKLLVHVHTNNSFVVKLSDPGLFSYTQADIHWLPTEFHANPELARRSTRADVWALGTTMWQIFSRGAVLSSHESVEVIKNIYRSGKRLSIPDKCPIDVYKLMTECWVDSNGPQKSPQAIMRDINRIHYQVYNSRRTHAYAIAFPKLFNDYKEQEDEAAELSDDYKSSDGESQRRLFTDLTRHSFDDGDQGAIQFIRSSESDQQSEDELCAALMGWWGGGDILKANREPFDYNLDKNLNGGLFGQMQDIFELGADCNVILQGRIGQGFYGEVYRGILERDNGKDSEPQQVAVKKLKTHALEADLRDFEREITIMKSLKHKNVVEILGVISEPEVCLVMEYVKHGSLQSYLAIHGQSLTHKRLLKFALDIATGMHYLGQHRIVHRDLAARNILVADENEVKISDFGLAQVTDTNDYYILQTNRDLPIKWYAPESLRDGKFSTKSDVWSFGVTMYETFSLGEDPKLPGIDREGNGEIVEGSAELLNALEQGLRLPCPSNCPEIIYMQLMRSCWQLQSHQRPDFSKLREDIDHLMFQAYC